MLEIVLDAETVANIQRDFGGARGAFKVRLRPPRTRLPLAALPKSAKKPQWPLLTPTVLNNATCTCFFVISCCVVQEEPMLDWFQSNKPSNLSLDTLKDTFVKSCAGAHTRKHPPKIRHSRPALIVFVFCSHCSV